MPPKITSEEPVTNTTNDQQQGDQGEELYPIQALVQNERGEFEEQTLMLTREQLIQLMNHMANQLTGVYSKELLQLLLESLNTKSLVEYCFRANWNGSALGTGPLFRARFHTEQWNVKLLPDKSIIVNKTDYENKIKATREVEHLHHLTEEEPKLGSIFAITDKNMWMFDMHEENEELDFFKDHFNTCLVEFVAECEQVDNEYHVTLKRVLLYEDVEEVEYHCTFGMFSSGELRQGQKIVHPVPIGRECQVCKKRFKYTDGGIQITYMSSSLSGGCALQANHGHCGFPI